MSHRRPIPGVWRGVVVVSVVAAAAGVAALLTLPREDAGDAARSHAAAPATTVEGTLSALPAPALVSEGGAGEARAGQRPAAAWPGVAVSDRPREDPDSTDTGDWRDVVAAVYGRKAAADLPRLPGALHTHIAEGPAPEAARLPDAPVVASGAAEELQGWDGGPWWFGPYGLVRVKEAER